jgi:hypothetical protein
MKTYTYKTVGDLKIEADVYRPGDRPAVDTAMPRAREFIKGTLGAPPAAGGSEAGQAKPAAAPPIKTETSRQ